jgi:hypothetical protein
LVSSALVTTPVFFENQRMYFVRLGSALTTQLQASSIDSWVTPVTSLLIPFLYLFVSDGLDVDSLGENTVNEEEPLLELR